MDNVCLDCEKAGATLECGLCAGVVCKSCAHFANEESVALLVPAPAHFVHGVFCRACFDGRVANELAAYQEIVARAENVNVFYKTQSKESRFVRRTERPVRVLECPDQDQALLRLAFSAAQAGFNTLVDVEMAAAKVRNGGWQTSNWSASGIPALVNQRELDRKFANSPN